MSGVGQGVEEILTSTDQTSPDNIQSTVGNATSDPTGFANQTATGITDTSDQTVEPAEDSANETQSSGQDGLSGFLDEVTGNLTTITEQLNDTISQINDTVQEVISDSGGFLNENTNLTVITGQLFSRWLLIQWGLLMKQ